VRIIVPSFSVLNDIAKTLQSQFISALTSAPDIDFPVTTETLTLDPPSEGLGSEVVASLYLYHVDIDPHLMNRRRISDPEDPSLMIKPPLPLQLKFLFVPLDSEADNNQLMMGRILQHFHDNPVFRPTPGTPLAISRGGAPEEIRVRFDFAPYSDLATLWSGFNRPFRLSAGFMVEIVTLDSGAAALPVPRTTEVIGKTEVKLREQDA